MEVTDTQIMEAQDIGRRAAKARRQGDEHLAQHLERSWRHSLPAYGTDERRWLEATYANAYREEGTPTPKPFR